MTDKVVPTAPKLTHVDQRGQAQMVAVGNKPITARFGVAIARCEMSLAAASAIRANEIQKGDVLQVAKLAAIGAAKRTDELIPLCHSIPLDAIEVEFQWRTETCLEIGVTAKAMAKTGVEMEAMVGASLAALTIYDMCKAVDREMTISTIQLVEKRGGSRGNYTRKQ